MARRRLLKSAVYVAVRIRAITAGFTPSQLKNLARKKTESNVLIKGASRFFNSDFSLTDGRLTTDGLNVTHVGAQFSIESLKIEHESILVTLNLTIHSNLFHFQTQPIGDLFDHIVRNSRPENINVILEGEIVQFVFTSWTSCPEPASQLTLALVGRPDFDFTGLPFSFVSYTI